MRKRFLSMFYALSYYLGIIAFFYWINRKKQRVLVYHNVIPDQLWDDTFHLVTSIRESTFREHLALISKRFRFSGRLDERGTVMFTFDDGYRCARIAAGILEEYSTTGLFFMPVDNIGSERPLWIDKIMLWFSYVPDDVYEIGGTRYSLTSREERAIGYTNYCNRMYEEYRLYTPLLWLEELDTFYPFRFLCGNIPMELYSLRFTGLSVGEISMLKERGHKFGGHSSHHDILSLLDRDELRDDFIRSSDLVTRDVVNTAIYAYPFGHFRDVSPEVIAECEKSMYTHAFMNEDVKSPTPYTRPRLNLGNSFNRYELEARLSGYHQFLKNIYIWTL